MGLDNYLPPKYIPNVNLSDEIRKQFGHYGRQGGLKRAREMTSEARKAVARRAATTRWTRARFGASTFSALGLPGGELVDAGLADLASGAVTVESSLVSLAAPRLRREGVPLGEVQPDPEDQLYSLLCESAADLAHVRYTAYLRQIASFADTCGLVRQR